MTTLRLDIYREVQHLKNLIWFNRMMSGEPSLDTEQRHEYHVIAHTQQVIVDRLQHLLDETRPASPTLDETRAPVPGIDKANTHPDQEEVMNTSTVKSLAGTGKDYCQFVVEVSGGAWGLPQIVALVENNGGCGGGTKRTPLTKFDLPINLPAGTYAFQAKRTGGGCGEAKGAHVQFKFPLNMPSAAAAKGNRTYGWAFETVSPELIARLG